MPALEKLGAAAPWLRITGCVSDEPDFAGERGNLTDVVARHGPWAGHDAYLAGSSAMISAMSGRLVALGVPASQIHVEDFGWSES